MNMRALFFPYMHPELNENKLPDWVLFLDPGIAKAKGYTTSFYQPGNLKITEKDALRYLENSLNFGEQFQDPKEISYLLGADYEDFYQETSMEIRSLLEGSDMDSEISEKDNSYEYLKKAQMALLLSWALEERLKEYKDLQQGVNDQWENLLQDLGVESEEDSYLPGLDSGSQTLYLQRELDWLKILPWFLFFAGDWSLFVEDSQIIEQWKEHGLLAERFSPDYPDLYCISAYGYELILDNKIQQNRFWLNRQYQVIYRAY